MIDIIQCCSFQRFQGVLTSRRSSPLFQPPRCSSYASLLLRQQCCRNPPAARWVRILSHGAIGRRATGSCSSGDTSHHPHGSSDTPPRAMTLADWSGNTRENAKMTVDFEECIKDSPRFRQGCSSHIQSARTFFYAWVSPLFFFLFFFKIRAEHVRTWRIYDGINRVNDTMRGVCDMRSNRVFI